MTSAQCCDRTTVEKKTPCLVKPVRKTMDISSDTLSIGKFLRNSRMWFLTPSRVSIALRVNYIVCRRQYLSRERKEPLREQTIINMNASMRFLCSAP